MARLKKNPNPHRLYLQESPIWDINRERITLALRQLAIRQLDLNLGNLPPLARDREKISAAVADLRETCQLPLLPTCDAEVAEFSEQLLALSGA